jgi:hypothetical protein
VTKGSGNESCGLPAPLIDSFFSTFKNCKYSKSPLPTTSTNYLPPDTAPMTTRGTFPTPHVPSSHSGLLGMTATSLESSDTQLTASTVAANSRRAERTVKAELGERQEGSRQGREERPASPVTTDAYVRERPNARPHRGPKAPVLHAQPAVLWVCCIQRARPARRAPRPLLHQK